MPGMNCWITEYGIRSAIILLTISVGVCPNYWRSDMSLLRLPDTSDRLVWGVMHKAASTDCELFSACHNDAGFPGEMTSNEATTASFAFEMRTFLVRTLN